MTKSEQTILRAIQKNVQMAMDAIQALENKVYDDALAVDLNKQAVKYTEIKNRVSERLRADKAEPYHERKAEKAMLWSAVQMNTMLNTSTSHIAELMIQGSNRGITQMCRTLNHNDMAGKFAVEAAKELMDFEEKNISRMKEYL